MWEPTPADRKWELAPERLFFTDRTDIQVCRRFKTIDNTGTGLLKHLREDRPIMLAFEGKKGQRDKPADPPRNSNKKSDTAAYVEGTVHYDKSANTPEGGTSKLQGSCDGRTWNYTWRNSYNHYGNGALTMNEDGTGMKGWWVDNLPTSKQRGNWWLYRK